MSSQPSGASGPAYISMKLLDKCLQALVASAFLPGRNQARPERQQVLTAGGLGPLPSAALLTRVSHEPFPQAILCTVGLGKQVSLSAKSCFLEL